MMREYYKYRPTCIQLVVKADVEIKSTQCLEFVEMVTSGIITEWVAVF